VFTDVWFGVRTSNGRKWRKTIPLAGNKHCYELMKTAVTGAARERRKSAQKGGSRGGIEKDRGWREGGHDKLFYAAGSPLPHRRSRYRKLRTLTALRPHVRIRITGPCPHRTSGLISRRHAGLRRPPPAAP